MIKRKKVFCPIIPFFLYPTFERWLEKMMIKGYKLSEYTTCNYIFKSCNNKNTSSYFMFNIPGLARRDEGKYYMEFTIVKDAYGIKQSQSLLNAYYNKNNNESIRIIEIDNNKIDNAYYYILKRRNLMITLRTWKTTIAFAIIFIGIMYLYYKSTVIFTLCICLLSCSIIYSIIGSLVLLWESMRNR